MSPTDATAVINIQDYLADLTVAQRRRVKILLWHAAALVKRGFCTLAHARDANGDEVPLRSPLAVQWDAPGAILRAGYDQQLVPSDIFSADDAAVVVAADNLLLLTVGEGTIRWSDRHTGKEVAATMCALADRVERVAALPQETRGAVTAILKRKPTTPAEYLDAIIIIAADTHERVLKDDHIKWLETKLKAISRYSRLLKKSTAFTVVLALLLAGCSDLAGGLIYLDWLAASVTTTIREDWGGELPLATSSPSAQPGVKV